MKREQLKDLQLTDKQIEQIMKLNGHDIEKAKGSFETLQAENEALKKQTADYEASLKSFKKSAKDNEELTAQIEEQQKQSKKQKDEFEANDENGKKLLEINIEKDLNAALDTHKYSNINKVINTQTDYTEAQIHGNLFKDDIAYVRIKKSEATDDLMEFLSEQSIKYEVIKDEEPGNSSV
ncbi:MAG: phage scaffolding protein [Lactobacillus equicursoris]|uniref:phage scaffolding protein n=1 Tax=Lactobacillus equicursoris TaxID=420645 RepID=UPI00242FAE93|nr:phage scaffolding protein [Lactobacillus equicursoris]MDD6407462.1 phage scaffolding protein [Lactobacillus equicursoris]